MVVKSRRKGGRRSLKAERRNWMDGKRSSMVANGLHRPKAWRSYRRRRLLVRRHLPHLRRVHRGRRRSCNQREQQARSLLPRLKESASAWFILLARD
jgi:hypothetical protein